VCNADEAATRPRERITHVIALTSSGSSPTTRASSGSPARSSPNDDWLVERRYLFVESMQLILGAEQYEPTIPTQQDEQQRQEIATLNPA
jgi:hypothetical protein